MFLKLTPHRKRLIRKVFSPLKRIGLKKEFSIISNNCWGGRIYDKFGLKYLSPTIGIAMQPLEYSKFISNLDYYLSLEPVPIIEKLNRIDNEHGNYPVMLGDIEFSFVHYRDVYDGINKWSNRKKRIVKDNIIVKMSYTPKGVEEDEIILNSFAKVHYKKILFTCDKSLKERNDLGLVVVFPEYDDNCKIINEIAKSDKLLKLKELKKIINKE